MSRLPIIQVDQPHHRCARHGISILVHERIDVVVDQCRNFETFAPFSAIMLHVSSSADLDRVALAQALDAEGCTRTTINPVSVPTRWGSIIGAHLANVRALEAVCDADAYVALNASNDMLLRSLPPSEGRSGARFERREVSPTSIWYTGRGFGRSTAFSALAHALGCSELIGSQIEGSSYPLSSLLRLADQLERLEPLLAALPDQAEEVVFPTWANEQLGIPPLRPFILFRPSRLTGAAGRVVPRALRRGPLPDLVQKAANKVRSRFRAPDADPNDVEAVIMGTATPVLSWPHGWFDADLTVHHGVKRVTRRFDDPLRIRIRAHTDAVRARRMQEA